MLYFLEFLQHTFKNQLTVTRGEGEGQKQGKEGEKSSQGRCIKDLRTRTMVRGLECGRGVARAWESNRGKMGTTEIEQYFFLNQQSVFLFPDEEQRPLRCSHLTRI